MLCNNIILLHNKFVREFFQKNFMQSFKIKFAILTIFENFHMNNSRTMLLIIQQSIEWLFFSFVLSYDYFYVCAWISWIFVDCV